MGKELAQQSADAGREPGGTAEAIAARGGDPAIAAFIGGGGASDSLNGRDVGRRSRTAVFQRRSGVGWRSKAGCGCCWGRGRCGRKSLPVGRRNLRYVA